RMVGEHLAQQGDRAHVRIFGHAVVKEAGATEVLHQPFADRIRIIATCVSQVLVRPRLRLGRQSCVPRLEERPPVMTESVHQSPSNSGLRFAANASYARRKSWFCMSIACAWASISIAWSTP